MSKHADLAANQRSESVGGKVYIPQGLGSDQPRLQPPGAFRVLPESRPWMFAASGAGLSASLFDRTGLGALDGKIEASTVHNSETISEIKNDIREIKHDARTDFRLLFAALITVALGLAGLMAKGFEWF